MNHFQLFLHGSITHFLSPLPKHMAELQNQDALSPLIGENDCHLIWHLLSGKWWLSALIFTERRVSMKKVEYSNRTRKVFALVSCLISLVRANEQNKYILLDLCQSLRLSQYLNLYIWREWISHGTVLFKRHLNWQVASELWLILRQNEVRFYISGN